MSRKLDRGQHREAEIRMRRTVSLERTFDRRGETKYWNGPMDDNRDYHRSLANSLIDDLSDEDAWDLAIEFGWDGVIAQLGGRARHHIAHNVAQR